MVIRKKALGAWLRNTRWEMGFSLRAIEAESGINRGTISQIESGEREASPEHLELLRVALGLKASEMPEVKP